MRVPRWSRVLLALFILLIGAAVVFHTQWLTWLGASLVEDQTPQKADMIAVLGGDLRGTRVLKAAELAWQGYAPFVLVSGAGDVYGRHESDLAVEWAVAHGFDEKLFVKFKYPAESTRDEAQAVIREMRRRGVKSFILVTSTYHTHRAAGIFRAFAPDLPFRVVASPDHYFTPDGWWKNREGEKICLMEWEKTVSEWFGN